MSGSVAVCVNRPFIADEKCMRMLFQLDEFIRLENATLVYTGHLPYIPHHLHYDEYAKINDSYIMMCVPEYVDFWSSDSKYQKVATAIQYLNLILTSLSLIAMAMSITTYLLFPEQRNFAGLTRLHFTISLFTFQLLFLIGMRPSVVQEKNLCLAVALLLHYIALVCFFWGSVIAWDLYTTFATNYGMNRLKYDNNKVITLWENIVECSLLPWRVLYYSTVQYCIIITVL
jgi:hypothetical protein